MRRIISDEQLLPPKKPEPQPHPEPLPLPQNKRIRIKKIQLFPPHILEPQPQPQFDKSPILSLQISFTITYYAKRHDHVTLKCKNF